MKRCPSCDRNFDDDSLRFCPNDGAHLVSEGAQASGDLQATIMATPSMRPSNELPPPEAFGTNASQYNQPPAPQPDPWANQYNANPSWTNQQTPPPPQNPTWQTPSAPLPAAPAKSGMNMKLLIGGGIGCLGLLIVGVIGIAVAVALFSPSSRMNPYKGSLRDLAPMSIESYKQTDVDTLGDRDKEGFGRVREAIGVSYKGSGDDKTEVFIGNYDSAADAKDGLSSFRDKLSSRGWRVSTILGKKIGWATVGSTFSAYRSTSGNRPGAASLTDNAVTMYAQSSTASPSPSKTKTPEINCWTNGSVLYAVASDSYNLYVFEKAFDKAQK